MLSPKVIQYYSEETKFAVKNVFIDSQLLKHHSEDYEDFLVHYNKYRPVCAQIKGSQFELRTMLKGLSDTHGANDTKITLVNNAKATLQIEQNDMVDNYIGEVVDYFGDKKVKATCFSLIEKKDGGFVSQFIELRKMYENDYFKDYDREAVVKLSSLKAEHFPKIIESLENAYCSNISFLDILLKLNDFCSLSGDNLTFLASSQSLVYIIGVKIAIPALSILVQRGFFQDLIQTVLRSVKPAFPYYRYTVKGVTKVYIGGTRVYTGVKQVYTLVGNELKRTYDSISVSIYTYRIVIFRFFSFGGAGALLLTYFGINPYSSLVNGGVAKTNFQQFIDSEKPSGIDTAHAEAFLKALQDAGYFFGSAGSAFLRGVAIASAEAAQKFLEAIPSSKD